jgi:hypothetical protein
MRNVRLLKRRYFIGGQFHVHGCKSVVEMLQFGRTDDRSGDDRFGQQPGERHLGTRNAARRGDLRHPIDDLAVGILGLREQPREGLVGFGTDAGVVPVASQLSARLRAPRDDADPLGRA